VAVYKRHYEGTARCALRGEVVCDGQHAEQCCHLRRIFRDAYGPRRAPCTDRPVTSTVASRSRMSQPSSDVRADPAACSSVILFLISVILPRFQPLAAHYITRALIKAKVG